MVAVLAKMGEVARVLVGADYIDLHRRDVFIENHYQLVVE